jgi:hypothetical protein
VEAGKTYRFRIINAASLTYQTVCFGGHNVTVIEADARPLQPFSAQCVDVNVGQRWVWRAGVHSWGPRWARGSMEGGGSLAGRAL